MVALGTSRDTGEVVTPARQENAAQLPGLDLERLFEYITKELDSDIAGPMAASLIAGGRSNLTYYLSDGTHDWVLRRPPLGHVLPTAHDMNREYTIISALAESSVPVPRTIAYCGNPDVIGAPFFIMERVAGRIYRSADDCAGLDDKEVLGIAEAFWDVLADLHVLDPYELGLASFGRPEGFAARQVSRWKRQLDASCTRELPGATDLFEHLGASVPAPQRTSVLHGDYRLDNLVISPNGPQTVKAVLDWEMSTIGDPLMDLGIALLYWDGLEGIENPIVADAARMGRFIPSDKLIERYCARTGLSTSALFWYAGFAYFKFAAILEGIHCRFVKGLTVGEGFDRVAELVPLLIARGLDSVGKGVRGTPGYAPGSATSEEN
ncbi:MAG: phosphotransferase family protein [Actinomycetota bacterium]|nr:phosphotransferase family protein [Actinomycetota bacterium]